MFVLFCNPIPKMGTLLDTVPMTLFHNLEGTQKS